MNEAIIMLKGKLSSSLGRDIVWTFGGQFVIMLCLLLINKVLSNHLSVGEFGQYNIIKRSVSVLSFIMLGGTGIAVPRYLALYLRQKRFYAAKNIIIVAIAYVMLLILFVCGICLLLHSQLIFLIIGDNDWCSLLIVLLYSVSLVFSSFIYAYLRGIGKFKAYNVTQIFYQLFMLFPLIGVANFTAIHFFLLWTIIGLMLCILWTIWELRRTGVFLFRHLYRSSLFIEFKEIIKYSPLRLLGDFFLFGMSAFPTLYIGNHISLEAVSYFSVGMTFVSMVTPIFSFLGVILLPYVTKCVANKNLEKANAVVNHILYADLVIAFSLVGLLYILMPFVVTFFFSQDYLASVPLARILVLSIIPSVFYLLYRNPIDAVSVVPYNTIILLICFSILIVAFIYSSNIEEYAWSCVAVSFLKGGSSYFVWKYIKIHYK